MKKKENFKLEYVMLSILIILLLLIIIPVIIHAAKNKQQPPMPPIIEEKIKEKNPYEELEKLFKFRKVEDGYAIEKYIGKLSKVTIPTEYKGLKVNKIDDETFANVDFLEKVDVSNTIEGIGNKTFFNCKNLKEITLADGLKEILSDAFSNTGLTSVNIPNTVKKIGEQAFCNTPIESIIIPKLVEKIEAGTFSSCTNLKAVTLNEGLKEIALAAFEYSLIESITIPGTEKKIGELAFYACHNFKTIDCKIKKSYYDAHKSDFIGIKYFERDGGKINWLNG